MELIVVMCLNNGAATECRKEHISLDTAGMMCHIQAVPVVAQHFPQYKILGMKCKEHKK